MLRWGGRYIQCQGRLHIIVMDIFAPALRTYDAQTCFSILASCQSVNLIATVENLDVAVMWDRHLFSRFQWNYFHLPTFEHNTSFDKDFPFLRSDACNVLDVVDTNESALPRMIADGHEALDSKSSYTTQSDKKLYGSGMAALLKSMTKHHHEILKTICWMLRTKREREQDELHNERASRSKQQQKSRTHFAVSGKELFNLSKKKWIVKDMSGFNSLLKEFEDHDVLKIGTSKNSDEILVNLTEQLINDLEQRL